MSFNWIGAVLIIIVGVTFMVYLNGWSVIPADSEFGTKFKGVIEEIDTGCAVDGTCIMVISGREVIFTSGWSDSEWGKVRNFDPFTGDRATGKKAEVYAKKMSIPGADEEQYTLEGRSEYYIRLLAE